MLTPAGVKLKTLFVRAAQWRMMLRGQDKWEVFCKAHKAWREEQGAGISERAKQGDDKTDFDVRTDPAWLPEEELASDAVPFGFESTGDYELLLKERAVRRGRREEALAVAQAGTDTNTGWGCTADSD